MFQGTTFFLRRNHRTCRNWRLDFDIGEKENSLMKEGKKSEYKSRPKPVHLQKISGKFRPMTSILDLFTNPKMDRIDKKGKKKSKMYQRRTSPKSIPKFGSAG